MDTQVEGLSFNHTLGTGPSAGKMQDGSYQAVLDLLDSAEHQLGNPNQNQNYGGGGRHNVPNIILTGTVRGNVLAMCCRTKWPSKQRGKPWQPFYWALIMLG